MKNFFVIGLLCFVMGISIAYSKEIPLGYEKSVPQKTTITSNKKSFMLKGRSNCPLLQGSKSKQEDTLYYDGDNQSGIGSTQAVSYYAGVRFTPSANGNLTAVIFYHNSSGAHNGNVHIYGAGTDTTPGTELATKPYSASGKNWTRVELTSPVAYSQNVDFWVAVNVSAAANEYPIGIDQGPMAQDRSFLSMEGDTWYRLKDVQSLDYNWNIRAIVTYGSVEGPQIRVSPTFLDFYMDTAAKSKAGPEKMVPEISENDPEYWEDIIPGRVIIGYYNHIDVRKSSLKELGIANKKGVTLVERSFSPLNSILVEFSSGNLEEMKNFIADMKKNPNVKYAEPDRKLKFFANPNDPGFVDQWDKKALNAPAAWDYGWGSDAISVAILDCGTEYTHQDLQARYGSVKGYDTYSNDSDPKPESGEYHGTYCSGTACATINNGIGAGGVSNSRLYSIRVGTATGGDAYAVSQGIAWCINNNVKILSMSFGGTVSSSDVQNACQSAWNAGCLLFSASGNDGQEMIQYPCGYSSVIAVGSTNKSNQRSSFSNYGSHIGLVAPGESCPTTGPGNDYILFDGTSCSCPQAAGCAALVWSANTTLTNQEVKDILTSTAVDIAPTGWDKYTGWGKPNLLAAVQMAIGGEPSDTTGMIMVYNESFATEALNVSNITYKASWVKSVSPTSFTLNPGESTGVNVIVGGILPAGTYYDTLNILSNDTNHSPSLVILRYRANVGVEEKENEIVNGRLNIYPNPCRQKTNIRYNVGYNSKISIKLYDLSGRLVSILVDKEMNTGTYTTPINTEGLSSGIYFLKLHTGKQQSIYKLVLVK